MFNAAELTVIPVVCFRNEAAWRESWRNEIDRWQHTFRHPPGEGNGNISGDWYFERDAVTDFWQQLGPVRVLDYDDAVAKHGTILPALLDAMEIEDTGETETYFLNASA